MLKYSGRNSLLEDIQDDSRVSRTMIIHIFISSSYYYQISFLKLINSLVFQVSWKRFSQESIIRRITKVSSSNCFSQHQDNISVMDTGMYNRDRYNAGLGIR